MSNLLSRIGQYAWVSMANELLSRVESAVLSALLEEPTLTQKQLSHRTGSARNTSAKAVKSLIGKGLLLDRGFYRAKQPQKSTPVTGFVLIRSPEKISNIEKLEAVLAQYQEIGTWYMISGRGYDYFVILHVSNTDERLNAFYTNVRNLVGAGSETHFIVPGRASE